ncbi:MAG: hypothetical protein WCF77_04835 [Minisyncoccia bacterium]
MKLSFVKSIVLILLLAAVVLFQFGYDATKPAGALPISAGLSPDFIRAVNMGFHAGVGSFLWAGTMPEILDLIIRGNTEYLPDERYVNAIDPKLSYPYAFTVIVLPAAMNYAGRVTDALAIGRRGIENADPDWRIPYYMATDYFLELKDDKDALLYYNIAARTPGIPDYALRFSLNFGIKSNQRQKTEELWATIRDSSNDESTKERAQAYIDRLEIFDYLDAASKIYQEKFGRVPTSTTALVTGNIIPAVPQDPFGFAFVVNKDGMSGINTTSSFSAVIPQ